MVTHGTQTGKVIYPHKVSVIIPAYNMANYLGEAVQGVLDQTYQNLEVIVVNDASTDHTDQIMQQFQDQRVKYIIHPENRYAAAARNTGIQASDAGFIAFFDADDKMHSERIATQVEFLERNPEIGLAYCSRIEIDQNGSPLALAPAPPIVSLQDLVLGYPYAPSEVLIRREWLYSVGLFDESFRFHGEDPDLHMRLALHGCKMAGLRRVLNYRRLHAGRVHKNLPMLVEDEIQAFQNTFASPLCLAEIKALRGRSFGMLYRILSFAAFSQNETTLGRELIRKAVEIDAPFFAHDLSRYIDFLVRSSVRSGGNHENILRSVTQQLVLEFEGIDRHIDFAIGYGYLLRWARDFLWGRVDSGIQNFEKARSYGSKPNERILNSLTANLIDYEEEFGLVEAREVLDRILSFLRRRDELASARKLKSSYMINHAFRAYRFGEHAKVIPSTLEAIVADPSRLANRGVLSMIFRSTIERLKKSLGGNLAKS